MKKARFAALFILCLFILAACSGEKEDILNMGINAEITGIDEENKTLTVKDTGEKEILGSSCVIDCSEAYIIYCDYDTGDVGDIDFEDLVRGDDVILSIYDSQLELMEKGSESIKADQVQLGTQRMKLENVW